MEAGIYEGKFIILYVATDRPEPPAPVRGVMQRSHRYWPRSMSLMLAAEWHVGRADFTISRERHTYIAADETGICVALVPVLL